jgi:hypothetical protein
VTESEDTIAKWSVEKFVQIVVKSRINNDDGTSMKLLLEWCRDIEIALADMKKLVVLRAWQTIESVPLLSSEFPLLLDAEDVEDAEDAEDVEVSVSNASERLLVPERKDGALTGKGTFTSRTSASALATTRTLRVCWVHILAKAAVKYLECIKPHNLLDEKLVYLAPTTIVRNYLITFLTKKLTFFQKSTSSPWHRRLREADANYEQGVARFRSLIHIVATTSEASLRIEHLACNNLLLSEN